MPPSAKFPVRKSNPEEPKKDLVDLNLGDRGHALKKSAVNAGEFLLKNCLPLLGAALAGPVGLLAGAVATGAIAYVDGAGKSLPDRLSAAAKNVVVTSAVAGGLGLPGLIWAPLAPLLQGGAAALGTAAAGALEFGASRVAGGGEVKAGKLASEFQSRAQKLLHEAGHPEALKEVGGGFAFSEEARRFKNQLRLVQTALVVNHLLGPAVAVSLAGDIGRERTDSDKLTAGIDRLYDHKAVSSHQTEGIEVRRIEGLAKRDRSMGSALYNLVLLDSEYHPETGDPKTDFVVGHEMSHVRWRDSSATLAQNALKEAVDEVLKKAGNSAEQRVLLDLANDLNEAQLADSRRMENRADQEALEYALSRGHQGSEILRSAAEIFGEEDSPDAFQMHPSGAKRMAALRRSLETGET